MHVAGRKSKPCYVRVNTLKKSPDEVIKIFREDGWILVPPQNDYSSYLEVVSDLQGSCFMRDFHLKEVLVFPAGSVPQLIKHTLYLDVSLFIQDKASCLAAHLVNPDFGSTVLDMCAAPGNKTTHLSALLRNKGLLVAVELNEKRYRVLCEFVESAGCKNVRTVCSDSLRLSSDVVDHQAVEYILVDPTCSGFGMAHRRIIDSGKAPADRLKRLSGFQYQLLLHALTAFPSVKRVVYSTCSVESEENEKVVHDVLKKLEGQFQLVPAMEDTWLRRGSQDFEHGNRCVVADPELDLTNGFFIAVIERNPCYNPQHRSQADGVHLKKIEKSSRHETKPDETLRKRNSINRETSQRDSEENAQVGKPGRKKKKKKEKLPLDDLDAVDNDHKTGLESRFQAQEFGEPDKKKKKRKKLKSEIV